MGSSMVVAEVKEWSAVDGSEDKECPARKGRIGWNGKRLRGGTVCIEKSGGRVGVGRIDKAQPN